MALKNATTDLDANARAAVLAANINGVEAARAGTAAIHASETAIVNALFAACRGRGIANPVALLLAEYDKAQGSRAFDLTAALACAATPNTLDESRAIENT